MSSWREQLAGERTLHGLWIASGSAYVAEIIGGSGADAVIIDTEHGPSDLPALVAQLQALSASPMPVLVRVPSDDGVLIKQVLDAGVQNLIVPMVESADQAARAVAATRYPPAGIRGVGGAFARASDWGRAPGYLADADAGLSVTVQIESSAGLAALPAIASVAGVDAVFLGPADLAASLGHLGQPAHPEVVAAIEAAIPVIVRSGRAACVSTFDPRLARHYGSLGARLVVVGADVTLLAQGSVDLLTSYRTPEA